MRLFAVLLALSLFVLAGRAALRGQEAKGDAPPAVTTVRLIFGLKDQVPTEWSGSVVAAGGRVLAIEGWRFLQGDRVDAGAAWIARTRLAPSAPSPLALPGAPAGTGPQAPQPVGVTLTLSSPPPERLEVRTAQGTFEVHPAELRLGGPLVALDGNARAERVPSPVPVADTPAYEDYPAVAADPSGGLWVAWVAYQDRAERIFCRRFDGGAWGPPEAVTGQPGDYHRPAIAVDGRGRLWAVWSARDGANWDLWARSRDRDAWSEPERLTTTLEPDLEPRLAADGRGALLLAWQGFRGGQADILSRRLEGDRWSREQRVSDSPANDWDPAVAADGRGGVAVAWDTYDRGNYDVRLRVQRDGEWGPVRRMTDSPLFEAHPSLAFDAAGRLWIAWDESGPNWGKDTGFLVEHPGTRLYQGRRIRIGAVDGDRLREPATAIHRVLPESSVAVCELPQLGFDRAGRLWTFFRRRTARNPREDGWAAQGVWDLYATSYDGSAWGTPFALPRSTGRNDMRAALARDGQDRLWVAWATDNRSWQAPAPQNLAVMLATMNEGAASGGHRNARPPLALGGVFPTKDERPTADAQPPAPSPPPPIHPNERADVARVRSYRIAAGGRPYRILRGDLHRHTDHSPDGVGDGSLVDLYRYSLDAAAFDYILVTDHNDGNDAEYPWWRREQSNDLYFLPGRFVPLYGYERSVPYPNGHRNVIFPERGVRTLPIGVPERQGEANTGPILYPYLREHGGIATSHTSATSQGTDWRDNNPTLEPVVEIFQGYHTSYEHQGAPRTIDERTGLVHGAYKPDGFVWNALRKGYRLGFQASSDHISTHVSYACVLAQEFTRRGIIDALKQRHCYAATDNIVLDVRMGSHVMGDDFTTDRAEPLAIRVMGTAPIQQIDVIRNEKYVYTVRPGKPTVDLRYQDTDPAPGARYYYVRVMQADGQLAWASPIWVRSK